jgi:hypothetical protein
MFNFERLLEVFWEAWKMQGTLLEVAQLCDVNATYNAIEKAASVFALVLCSLQYSRLILRRP